MPHPSLGQCRLSHHTKFPNPDSQRGTKTGLNLESRWRGLRARVCQISSMAESLLKNFNIPCPLWLHLFYKLSIVTFKQSYKGMMSPIYSCYHKVRLKSLVMWTKGQTLLWPGSGSPYLCSIWFIFMVWHHFVPWCSFYCNLFHLPFTYLLGVCRKPCWLLFLKDQFVFSCFLE